MVLTGDYVREHRNVPCCHSFSPSISTSRSCGLEVATKAALLGVQACKYFEE